MRKYIIDFLAIAAVVAASASIGAAVGAAIVAESGLDAVERVEARSAVKQESNIHYWLPSQSIRDDRAACEDAQMSGIVRGDGHAAWYLNLTPADQARYVEIRESCEQQYPIPGNSSKWDLTGMVEVSKAEFESTY